MGNTNINNIRLETNRLLRNGEKTIYSGKWNIEKGRYRFHNKTSGCVRI